MPRAACSARCISARPVPEGTSPQAVAGLLESRIAALAPTIEARSAALEGRVGVIDARTAEAAQATAQRLAEVQRALDAQRAALDQATREGLAAAQARAEAQEQAGDFGAKLKTRAEAEQSVRTLLDSAFKALPTPAASAGR